MKEKLIYLKKSKGVESKYIFKIFFTSRSIFELLLACSVLTIKFFWNKFFGVVPS